MEHSLGTIFSYRFGNLVSIYGSRTVYAGLEINLSANVNHCVVFLIVFGARWDRGITYTVSGFGHT